MSSLRMLNNEKGEILLKNGNKSSSPECDLNLFRLYYDGLRPLFTARIVESGARNEHRLVEINISFNPSNEKFH
jgi:hypothetical protein